MITEANNRSQIMDELLTPLNESKAEVMRSLLENVQTSRLQSVFDKYLPAVLANKEVAAEAPQEKKAVLSESKEVTGDKKSVTTAEVKDDTNIINMKKLAGL
jgi:hypothetical protein